VELRDPFTPSTVVATCSGLVRRDLRVVAQDGKSPISFPVPAGNYYVAIRHRNHLGCMTAAPIALGTASPNLVLFADPTAPMYGTGARKTLIPGYVDALWMGNVVNNHNLKYTGSGNDRDPILVKVGSTVPTNTVSGYNVEDCNLDGVVKYTGSGNDRDPILLNVGNTTPNNVRVEQMP
jgi:hypothetical protein